MGVLTRRNIDFLLAQIPSLCGHERLTRQAHAKGSTYCHFLQLDQLQCARSQASGSDSSEHRQEARSYNPPSDDE